MPRKVRLTSIKNGERKRQAKKRTEKMQEAPDSLVSTPSPCGGLVAPSSPPPSHLTLKQLHASLPHMKQSWSDQSPQDDSIIQLCKIASMPHSSSHPMVITHSLIVQEDLTWAVFIHGHELCNVSETPLSSLPCKLDTVSLQELIDVLDKAHVCPGNPDEKFLPLAATHKGRFLSSHGSVMAHVEKNFHITLNGDTYSTTIRTTSCGLLVHGSKCESCKAYRPQLRAMYSRWSKKTNTIQKFGNNRYLNTPQKQEKLKSLQTRAYAAEKEVQKLRERIDKCTEQNGMELEQSFSDLVK